MSARAIDLGGGMFLEADPSGIRVIGVPIATNTSVSDVSAAGHQLLASLPSLLSEGIFTEESTSVYSMTLENALALEGRDYDPLAALINWSPFSLKIEGKGTLGFDDFKFIPRFYMGRRLVAIRSMGLLAWRSSSVYRLPSAHAIALEIIEAFNLMSGAEKTKVVALETLHKLKQLGSGNSDIGFDSYLGAETVFKPEKVILGTEDDGQRAVVYPVFPGLPEDEVKNQFLNITDVRDEYDIDLGGGKGRGRLILNPDIKEVLKSIKKNGFGLSGRTRSDFYRNPRGILPEGEEQNHDLIDVVGFGPRVKGIGFPTFARAISSTTKEDWFNSGENNLVRATRGAGADNVIAIECSFIDGDIQTLEFENIDEARWLLNNIKSGIARGDSSLVWKEIDLPISSQLVEGLEDVLKSNSPPGPDKEKGEERAGQKPRLLIHTNEEEIDYSEGVNGIGSNFELNLPGSLKAQVRLKDHQMKGVRWLSGLLARDLAKGCLLADDMGLGKTLQVLTFLGWCIENELKESLGSDAGPYEPVLIVAPLILLNNWQKEISDYFEDGIFSPLEILHGSNLKKFRKPGTVGRESRPGSETLDIERIRSNRIIITNYDTVKNYQYTFAKIPWSVVVIDEAQEIKEPSTATTYALKALNPLFRVASTGTPVETSLTNLWSIMDFAHPGNGLGSLKAFKKDYGTLSFDDPTLGERLRASIGFNTDFGLVLRRAKKDVLADLPPKTVIERVCTMDDDLIQKYEKIVRGVSGDQRDGMAPLQALHQLSFISQHPFLIEGQPFRENWNDYLTASSKLRELVSILQEVQARGEKALVFTRSRVMQDILKAVIDHNFGLDSSIINGDTASKHQYVQKSRSGILAKFSKTVGFNVLILSPEVAGVGLTITAANHVIHYGRWWNPAKENQATDRAYRIGQKLPVYVYQLLLKHPAGAFETFDEKLHRLLKSREELADNFLAPSGDEILFQRQLVGDLFSRVEDDSSLERTTRRVSVDRLTPYEFESFTALVLRSRFVQSYVTSRAGDRGVDVIGVNKAEILLIQCKYGKHCSVDAVDEIVDGADYYREHVLPRTLKQRPVRLAIATTGMADRSLQDLAKQKGIEVIDGAAIKQLHVNYPVDQVEIARLEGARVKNIDDLTDLLARAYGK